MYRIWVIAIMNARLVVLAAAVAAAAALILSPLDKPRDGDVRELEIRELQVGAGGVELIPVDGGAAGPESVAFGAGGEGPYTGVSDGTVARWLPGERRWVEHSSAAAPELVGMSTTTVLFAAVVLIVAAAIHSLGSRRGDVRRLEIGDGDVELIPLDDAARPESVAFGESGGEGPYTGVSDGRVLRWLPPERRWVEHSCSAPELLDSCRGSQDPSREHECGRPLGLKFNNKTGELYVADAYLGLRVVSPEDNVSRPLVPGSPGSPFSFANGVEIDHETGAIYFTETSTRFQRREFLNIVISGDTTGRLLKYDPENNQVEVLVDGLAFPNGLAMSNDGSYLLVAETTTGKILRYWLKTPRASTLEELAQLPGFPDNIKMSPRGGFWVGLHAKRGKIAEWSISYPWLRRLVLKLPACRVQRITTFLNRFGRQVIALRVSEEGKVMEEVSVRGAARKVFKSISEVDERDGCLWIGSVLSPFLGLYRL